MSLSKPVSPDELTQAEQRQHIISFGDLGGSYVRYKRVNTALGTTDEDLNWQGGARSVVYHGDILGDRIADGFDILGHLHTSMRKQIQAAGGSLTLLAGNHDDYAISYLTNRGGCHEDGISKARIKNGSILSKMTGKGFAQGHGLLEFTKFTGDRNMAPDFTTAIADGRLDRTAVLTEMRNDKLGKMILAEIVGMNLCHVSGNTLRVHTDPTEAMLSALMETDAATLNARFQNGVGEALIEGGEFDQRLNPLLDSFLATRNRTLHDWCEQKSYFRLSKDLIEKFVNKTGITTIIYGHSVVAEDCDPSNLVITKHGLTFVSVDLGTNSLFPSAAITTPHRLYTAEDLFRMKGVGDIK